MARLAAQSVLCTGVQYTGRGDLLYNWHREAQGEIITGNKLVTLPEKSRAGPGHTT